MDHKESGIDVEHVERNKISSLEENLNGYVPDTEEEKKLVKKIDLYLLPTIWLMYLLS